MASLNQLLSICVPGVAVVPILLKGDQERDVMVFGNACRAPSAEGSNGLPPARQLQLTGTIQGANSSVFR